jgi:large subunit ribosomal protein L29
MAKKKKEEIHYSQLNVEELSKKLEQVNQNLFKLRFRAVSAPLKNPMEIRSLRREVARIKTYMSQRRQNG